MATLTTYAGYTTLYTTSFLIGCAVEKESKTAQALSSSLLCQLCLPILALFGKKLSSSSCLPYTIVVLSMIAGKSIVELFYKKRIENVILQEKFQVDKEDQWGLETSNIEELFPKRSYNYDSDTSTMFIRWDQSILYTKVQSNDKDRLTEKLKRSGLQALCN